MALLVAYSQLIVKWRMLNGWTGYGQEARWIMRLLGYLLDPVIFSAYAAGLIGSFVWLFVIARLPLALAFPVYQGLTFALVILGSVLLLGETLSVTRLVAVSLILTGVILGVQD